MVRHYSSVFIAALLLSACAGAASRNGVQVKPDEAVATFGGPEVGTMEAALYNSAGEAFKKEEFSKSMQLYGQLVSRYPEKLEYLFHFAEAARRAGHYDDAQKAYVEFLKRNPDRMDAQEGRGLTQLAMGEVDRAIRTLSSVMQQDNRRWRTINALGVALSIKNKPDDALKYYREALNLDEQNPSILNNIGLTLAIKDDYERAIRALQLASKYYDGNELGRKRIDLNLAMVYGLSGDMEAAEATAKRHLSQSELYNNLGHYAFLADNKELARTYLNMALTKSPDHYEKAWKNLEELKKGR